MKIIFDFRNLICHFKIMDLKNHDLLAGLCLIKGESFETVDSLALIESLYSYSGVPFQLIISHTENSFLKTFFNWFHLQYFTYYIC